MPFTGLYSIIKEHLWKAELLVQLPELIYIIALGKNNVKDIFQFS